MALWLSETLRFESYFLCFLLCILFSEAKDRFVYHTSMATDTFEVIPGGSEHSFSETWNGLNCTFTYVAQGGTKEQWIMRFGRSKCKRHLECIVERPGNISYLFYEKFILHVGGNYRLLDGSAESAEGTENFYEVDKEARIVTNKQGYMGLLSKVLVYARLIEKHELKQEL